jgi:hypothetical protein
MIVRAFEDKDIDKVEDIHKKYFTSEFDIDNFNHLIRSAFVVEKHGDIICVGGVKSLAECVLITDMGISHITRTKALRQALNIFGYIARQTGHDSIHAFVNDDQWRDHLIDEGFKVCKGTPLVLEV